MLTPTSLPDGPQAHSVSTASFPRGALVVLGIWVAMGLAGARASVLSQLPPPLFPLVIWTPVVLAGLAYRRRPTLRDALRGVGLRPLILFHTVRAIIGVSFLVDGARGILPAAFARPAGWGDVTVGLLALPVALCAWRPGALPTLTRRRILQVWNTLGFVDILLAFVSAQRLAFVVKDPRMQAALGTWPYAVVPLLIVPAVLATHLLVFGHLARAKRS